MEDLNRQMVRRSQFLHNRFYDFRLDNIGAIHKGNGTEE